MIRISLIAIGCALGGYMLNSHLFSSAATKQVEKVAAYNKATNQVPEHTVDNYEDNEQPSPLQTSSSLFITLVDVTKKEQKIDREMDDSLEILHLNQFTQYLNGTEADESTILAFYTNNRWSAFYKNLGYQQDDIDQLIAFRNQYLADISQSGKEHYYQRWSMPPHSLLSETIANELFLSLENGEEYQSILERVLSDIASSYGISLSFVEGTAKKYLLKSMRQIELQSVLISVIEPQYDIVSIDNKFIDFITNQDGYVSLETQNLGGVGESLIKTMYQSDW